MISEISNEITQSLLKQRWLTVSAVASREPSQSLGGFCTINHSYPAREREGAGGHTEHALIWNETWCAYAEWDGYESDWKNISFNRTVILMPNETYNLELITGSYPQIHHNKSIKTESGMIKCKEFKDVNGIKHE